MESRFPGTAAGKYKRAISEGALDVSSLVRLSQSNAWILVCDGLVFSALGLVEGVEFRRILWAFMYEAAL